MEKNKSGRNQLKNGKSITRISILFFLIAVCVGFWGVYRTYGSFQRHQEMEKKRAFYRELGDSLESANSYLTQEVQAFAVTGQMSHFFNYWTEIDITKTREKVLKEMEVAGAPEEELDYLRRAKEISDELVQTEISAIQMVLRSRGISEDSYDEKSSLDLWVTQALSYPVDEKLTSLPVEELQPEAVNLLFDKEYLESKSTITALIDGFNTKMNERLDQEVEKSRLETVWAVATQILFICLSFAILGGILLCLHRLFVVPIQQYTEAIQRQSWHEQNSELKVIPSGSNEMVQFGEEFNRRSASFHQEMENRKKAEKLMAQAKEEAEQANQFKSRFLAQFSHEIRTPLNAVGGYTWLLQESGLEKNQKIYAENIRLAADNLLQVINHILDYSKIEEGKMQLVFQEFSFRQMIAELYSILEYEAVNKGICLKINIDEKIPDVLNGDRIRLYQVLQNLIYNGIKFTDQGEVALEASYEGNSSWGDTVLFRVKDTGCGIPEEQRQKIFEPFRQVDGAVSNGIQGTGLGLSICQEIVRLASSDRYSIQVKSEEEKGSCFSFKMDFMPPGQSMVSEHAKELAEEKIRILLVEDNPVNLVLEQKILKKMGYETDALKDPCEAEQYVREKKYSLILLDIGMPEMDGYELAGRLKKILEGKEVPILALTAYREEDIKEHPCAEQFDDYLAKPLDPVKLKEKIEIILEKNYIDFGELEELLGYNKENMKELLNIFLKDKKETEQIVIDALRQKDYRKVHDQIHALKGVSANLFCKALSGECAIILDKMKETIIEEEDLKPLFCAFRMTRKIIEEKIRREDEDHCIGY